MPKNSVVLLSGTQVPAFFDRIGISLNMLSHLIRRLDDDTIFKCLVVVLTSSSNGLMLCRSFSLIRL